MNRKSTKTSLSPQLALFAPRFDPGSTLLPYLKNQEKEVEAIHGLIPDASVSDQGTKESFLAASQKNAYLHLCAHGFVSSDPDSSFIAFYQKTAQADSSQFFYLSELYRHRLDQDLITLTACETALGQHRSGEGNISLARGFAYAGVKSFITTLWKIQTEGAARIIPSFYDHFLNQKLPKDVALALSKRAYLEEGKGVYPENWAGMILIGSSTAPSLLQESTKHELWIGSLALLLLVAWGVMMLKKRN
jgi:CHAT domain-containing protein